MRVVVTGGAGFIGANLVRRLLAERVAGTVTVLDDLSAGSAANLDGVAGAELVVGSVLDRHLVADVVDGAGAVVHLAARTSVPRSVEDPAATHDVNATGTLRVLEAVRRAGNPHTVVASSSSVYGDHPTLPKHEDLPTVPRSPYAASKLAAEGHASAFAACFATPVLVLRFFNVFGPLQPAGHAYAAVIPAFVSAAVEGRPLVVHGDGRQSRDFTFVGSVTAVLAEAVRSGVCHDRPVNLAFGTRQTLLDVIASLEEMLGARLDVEHTAARPGDVRHSQADQRRLRALFGDLAPVAFADGLRATLDWFRETAGAAPLTTPADSMPGGR